MLTSLAFSFSPPSSEKAGKQLIPCKIFAMELNHETATSDPEHPAYSENHLLRKEEDPVRVHHQCIIDPSLPLSHMLTICVCSVMSAFHDF